MYLFLLSLNNSGSTAISQAIAGAENVYLPPFGNNEGQFAPGVDALMRTDPWNPASEIDWPRVKALWDALLAASGREIFLEASPPNLVRLDAIRRHFPGARFLANISSPYAYCGSCWYRRGPNDRKARFLRTAAEAWLAKARHQMRNAAAPDVLSFTYESFCDEPAAALARIARHVPELAPVRGDGMVTVRGAVTPLVNYSNRNTLMVGRENLAAIGEVLADGADVVAHFGYRVLDEAAFDAIAADPVDRARAEKRIADKAAAAGAGRQRMGGQSGGRRKAG